MKKSTLKELFKYVKKFNKEKQIRFQILCQLEKMKMSGQFLKEICNLINSLKPRTYMILLMKLMDYLEYHHTLGVK